MAVTTTELAVQGGQTGCSMLAILGIMDGRGAGMQWPERRIRSGSIAVCANGGQGVECHCPRWTISSR